MYATETHNVSLTVPLHEPLAPTYFLSIISDRWLHAETRLPVSFKYLLLPTPNPPHTELLDLQPLPISAASASINSKDQLQVQWFHSHVKGAVDAGHFNSIQTQCFRSLVGDENVLLAAPAGSGLDVMADLVVFQFFNSQPPSADLAGSDLNSTDDAILLYVCVKAEVCAARFKRWSRLFPSVVLLTGMKRRVLMFFRFSCRVNFSRYFRFM